MNINKDTIGKTISAVITYAIIGLIGYYTSFDKTVAVFWMLGVVLMIISRAGLGDVKTASKNIAADFKESYSKPSYKAVAILVGVLVLFYLLNMPYSIAAVILGTIILSGFAFYGSRLSRD